MAKNDVVIKIEFDVNNPNQSIIKTNARKEALEEILTSWVRAQSGQGSDKSPPNRKSKYQITIKLDLDNDTFYTTSDTGNKSLTCGIGLAISKLLDNIKVIDLWN